MYTFLGSQNHREILKLQEKKPGALLAPEAKEDQLGQDDARHQRKNLIDRSQRQDHTPTVPAITIATPGAGKADTPPACRQALTTTPGAGKLGKFTLQGLQGTAHKRDATLQHEHSLSQYQGNAKKK
ncbi:hypothetical protein NDU88_011388 [Pleurodeles waltl]|uniref:Uncharacterized protein n=1 Tax=Pleurodeles waltl TaxID=8319 RepID=A0AAV7QXG7_PLEWA|nr:hypothetical protein NDU88_011388 [Pleurodeles waltl]